MNWTTLKCDDVGHSTIISGTLEFEVPERTLPGLDKTVRCRADVTIIKPSTCGDSKCAAFVDVVNRGSTLFWHIGNGTQFNPALFAEGNGFFSQNKFIYVACGWDLDLQPRPGFLTLKANDLDQEEWISMELDTSTAFLGGMPDARTLKLVARGSNPILPSDMKQKDAELHIRDTPSDFTSPLPREEWFFGVYEGDDPKLQADFISLKSGKFEKGKLVEVKFKTRNVRHSGLGLAAIQQCGNWLKHGNDCPVQVGSTYAIGGSQTGRLLRSFIFYDFNIFQGNEVYDGFFNMVSGSTTGQFNQLAGQAAMSMPHLATNRFPFSFGSSIDAITGETGGIHDTINQRSSPAKFIYVNTSIEYYRGDASLCHISPEGEDDVPLPENIRYYLLSGAPHNPIPCWPPTYCDGGLPINVQQTLTNNIDTRPFIRSQLLNLHLWVTQGKQPPESVYPRRSQLISHEAAYEYFKNLVNIPTYISRSWRREWGLNDGKCTVHPIEGKCYGGSLVPQLDNDGNDCFGVQLPLVAVPLASWPGWSLRHPDFGGENRIMMVAGGMIPFSKEKRSDNDQREPILSRYKNKEDFMEKITQHFNALVENRMLLATDSTIIVEEASKFWDYIIAL